MTKYLLATVLLLFANPTFAQAPVPTTPSVPPPAPTEEPIELDSVMMESTFLIEGPASGGGQTLGTVFIIGRPLPSVTPLQAVPVLVTAAHVLESIQGDYATLLLRKKTDEKTNQWVKAPFQLRIRENNRPLWLRNPDADVAAMNVALPDPTQMKPITPLMFVDDEKLQEYKVSPGDEVRCLGFPLGIESNEAGFPVLRSGKIASYPLTPTDKTKSFLVDLRVFKGNSGGPVFFVENNRVVTTGIGRYQNLHFIIGLVSEEKLYTDAAIGPYSQELHQTQLGLAVVVHASIILQTIGLLPFPAPQLP